MLFKKSHATFSVDRQLLEEAKAENYTFRIHQGEDIYPIASDDVVIDSDAISYSRDDAEVKIGYSEFSVQVLPRSKVVNLLVRQKRTMMMLLASAPAVVGAIILIFSSFLASEVFTEDFLTGFGVAVLAASYITMLVFIVLQGEAARMRHIRAARTSSPMIQQLEKTKDVEEYFSKLIQINLKNMEKYYLLVRTQTEKSYRLTQAGAVIGFLVLVAGIILSFRQGLNQPATAITLASGVLIEFISTIFFYIYNRTVRQLNKYHEKLVRVQDTMLALKVAQIVKDETLKDQTMAYLTRALTGRLVSQQENGQSEQATGENLDDKGA